MRKATIFIVVALLLTLCSVPVNAADMPPLPHAFYGTVEINGSAAPAGTTTVEAMGEGVETGTYNPITTTEAGKYGSADPLGVKLIVQGDIEDGAIITFYVKGVSTGQTAEWHSGETTELPLSATIAAPVGPGPGLAPAPKVKTNLFGVEASFSISDEGEILETIEATSEDGMLTLTIPDGTIALDEDGNPLESLEVAVDETPPDPPEDANIIGLAYNFGPGGATFDPPITITFIYDPDDLPEGVDEGDLVIAFYDEEAGEWVELVCVVDTVNNTITASVSHFTTFTIIGAVTPPEEEEIVPPEEEEVVLPPEEEVVLPPEEEVAPPEEEVPAKGINWPVVGGVIGGVIVVGLLIFFLARRRERPDRLRQ